MGKERFFNKNFLLIFGILIGIIFLNFISSLPIAYHSGTINSNQVWNNSYEHRINGSVIFQRNLTIEPGAIIIFEGYYQLQIYNTLASLNATGNSTHYITFMSNASSPTKNEWQYIRFYKTVYPSYLSYVNISNGYQALMFSTDSATISITNSIFDNNNISISLASDSKNKVFDNISLINTVYPLDLSGTDSENFTFNNFNIENFANPVYIHTAGNGSIYFNNFSLYNSTGRGIFCTSCNDVSFYNFSLSNISLEGVYITGSEKINISAINLSKIEGSNFYLRSSKNINITDFVIEDSSSGVTATLGVNESSLNNGLIQNLNYSGLDLIDINNFTISNLRIKGINSSRAIWIKNSSNVSIMDIVVGNSTSSNLVYLDSLNNSKMTNFEIYGSGPLDTTYDNMCAVCVYYTNNSYFANGTMRNMYNSGVGGDGFVFMEGSNFNLAENLTAHDNKGDGIQLVDGSDVNPVTNNIIRNSISYNNHQTGLELRRVHNNTLTNIIVFNNGLESLDNPAGLDIREYSAGNIFQNCTSYNNHERGGVHFGESGVQNNTFINCNITQNDINIYGDSSASENNVFVDSYFNGSRIFLENSSSYFIANWSVENYSSNLSIRYGYLGEMNVSLISKNFDNLTNKLTLVFDGIGSNITIPVGYNESTNFFSKDNQEVFFTVSGGVSSYENLNYAVNYDESSGLVNFSFPSAGYHLLLIQDFLSDGSSCDSPKECLGGYCNSGICASSAPSTTTENPGSGTGTFRPSENALQNGWSVNIAKNQKVEIPVGDENKTVKVESVSGEKVIVSIDGENYEIENSSSGKIDLDSDGFYDVEIVNNGVTGNYAKLEFKLINEKIESENEDGQNENILDKIPDAIKSVGWKIYVLLGTIIILIVTWFLLSRSKSKS